MNKYMLILFEHENESSVALDYITYDVERDFIEKKIQECNKHNYLSN